MTVWRNPLADLPPSLAAAWGLKERANRGPKPGLTLERIVDAGVDLARAEGLQAVSMARVAGELGSSPMSLYRYVDTKDELLELMVDAAIGPPPPTGDDGWRAGLSRWAWTYHDRLREHPWGLQVPISGPPRTPNALAWLEHGLRPLRETRLPEHEKASVVLLLSGHVRGEAALTADLTATNPTIEATMTGYADLLRAIAAAERFPALHAVLAAGVFDVADDPDVEFSFGLDRILDGVDALVRERERVPGVDRGSTGPAR
jgi:AcrR family transcriptional regulator